MKISPISDRLNTACCWSLHVDDAELQDYDNDRMCTQTPVSSHSTIIIHPSTRLSAVHRSISYDRPPLFARVINDAFLCKIADRPGYKKRW